jgi:hypothetical protein
MLHILSILIEREKLQSTEKQHKENTHQKVEATESRKYSPKAKAAESRKYSPKGRSRRVQDVQETSIITVSDSSP